MSDKAVSMVRTHTRASNKSALLGASFDDDEARSVGRAVAACDIGCKVGERVIVRVGGTIVPHVL